MWPSGFGAASLSHDAETTRDETLNTPQTLPLLMSRCLAAGIFSSNTTNFIDLFVLVDSHYKF